MLLDKVINGLEIEKIQGGLDINIDNIAYDSRKTRQGSLFVCIEGTVVDGHNYIKDAINNGTKAFLVQKDIEAPEDVTVIKIKDTRYGLAHVADNFFDHPSRKFNLIGITGTKGKTTTTYMIEAILEAEDHKVGLIGTVANLKRYFTHPAQHLSHWICRLFFVIWLIKTLTARLWRFHHRGLSCTV